VPKKEMFKDGAQKGNHHGRPKQVANKPQANRNQRWRGPEGYFKKTLPGAETLGAGAATDGKFQ